MLTPGLKGHPNMREVILFSAWEVTTATTRCPCRTGGSGRWRERRWSSQSSGWQPEASRIRGPGQWFYLHQTMLIFKSFLFLTSSLQQRDVEILRRLRPRCDSVGCAAERLQVGLCSLYRRSGGRVRPVSTQEGGSLMLVPEYNNILYFCSLNVSVISPHCFPYSVYILLHL